MKVFITGVTGFVGGHLHDYYSQTHTVMSYLRGQNITEVLDTFQPDLILHASVVINNTDTMFELNFLLTMRIL